MKSLLLLKIQLIFLIDFSLTNQPKKPISNKNLIHNNELQNIITYEIFSSYIKSIFITTFYNAKNKQKRNLNIFYNTFDNEFYSIYGTGNILKDVVYKVNCVIKCKSKCCSGEYFSNMICLSESQCDRKIQKVKKFILKIAFISYLSLAVFTSLIIFLVYFFLSKKFYDTRH